MSGTALGAGMQRRRAARRSLHAASETGSALVVTLLVLWLLSSIGAVLVVGAGVDGLISEGATRAVATRYGAEAALERALAELGGAPDLSAVLDGSFGSAFVDGPPGPRSLPGGISLDLRSLVAEATCGSLVACTEADIVAVRPERPWGERNPRWRLFSYGAVGPPAGPATRPPIYAVVLVADDPADADNNPDADGIPLGSTVNPGAGQILARSVAFGPRGARRSVEALLVRDDLVARARWSLADPDTRGTSPAGSPFFRVLRWAEAY